MILSETNFFSDLQNKIEQYESFNEAEEFSFDVPEEAKDASKDDVQLGSKDPSDEKQEGYDPTKDPEVSDLIDSEEETDDDDEDDYDDYEDDEEALEDAVEDNDPVHESLDNIIETVAGKMIDTDLMDKVNSVYNESVLKFDQRTNDMLDYLIEGYNGVLESDRLLIENLLNEENSIDALFNNELLNEAGTIIQNPVDAVKQTVKDVRKLNIVTVARTFRDRLAGGPVRIKFREPTLGAKVGKGIQNAFVGGPYLLIPGLVVRLAAYKPYTFYATREGREYHRTLSVPNSLGPKKIAKAIEEIANTGKTKLGNDFIHEGFDFLSNENDLLQETLFTYLETDGGETVMLFDESLLEDEYGYYDETDAMDHILESADDSYMYESSFYEEDEMEDDEDLEEGWYFEDDDEDEDLEEATPVAIQADQAPDFDPLSSLKSMDEDWMFEEDEEDASDDEDLEESFWMEEDDTEEDEDLEEGWYFEGDDDDKDSKDDEDDSDEDDDEDDKDKDDDDEDKKDDDKDTKKESFDFDWSF